MTIAANYTLFYGEEFIEYSVKSIYDHVDKIYMSVGEMSWKNHHGKRFEPIDNLLEKVYEIPDPDKKIEIFTGIWDGDTEQRNFLLDKCIGNYDYAMLIDSDEVWEKREIEGLKGVAEEFKEDPQIKVIAVDIIQYYKSLYWGHKCTNIRGVNYLYKADGTIHHEWIRHPGTVPTHKCSAYYHHYGYAYPMDIIKKKVKMWGHSSEVDEKWFKTYKDWTPYHGQALSPTGDLWEPMIERELIPEMKGHRLSKVNYYTK